MSKCNTCVNKKYCENHLDARTICAKTDYVLFTPTYETNADRIRSMTNEELAEWIEQLESPKCPTEEMHENCVKPFCDGCWLEWLKTAVSE